MHVWGVRGWLLLLLVAFAPPLSADSAETLRVQVASRLFPSLLAADQAIEQKVSRDGKLLILVIYNKERTNADTIVNEIARTKTIRQLPVMSKVVTSDELDSYRNSNVAALFIAERLDSSLESVITFGREGRIITYSPFSADVERGVVGGILIRDRILPYINLTALRDASISLRPFYLKVAETYEQR